MTVLGAGSSAHVSASSRCARKREIIVFVTLDIDEAIYLADRVEVMTSQPGRVKRVVEVPPGAATPPHEL